MMQQAQGAGTVPVELGPKSNFSAQNREEKKQKIHDF